MVISIPERSTGSPPSSNGGARLNIRDLRVVYDDTVDAVRGVSLDVAPGEFVTLLGPSGSGKTSVLMAIAGLCKPASGAIQIDETDILSRPPNRRNLGLVFQEYALFPHMTVAQNIAFPLRMRRWPDHESAKAVDEALELVQLPGYGARYPRQLSGGERQRVALARAIVFHPPVLLMDEPLGALDKQLREQMQVELQGIQRRTGITTLYVTHDQNEALSLSDRIALMRAGRIEQIGTPTDLYERPANRFVAEFIGETNILSGHVRHHDGQPVLELEHGLSLPLTGSVAHRAGEQVEIAIRPERITLDDAPGDACANGYIEDVLYGGDVLRTRVRLNNGAVLVVKEQNREQTGDRTPGRAVTLKWSASAMLPLAKREGE